MESSLIISQLLRNLFGVIMAIIGLKVLFRKSIGQKIGAVMLSNALINEKTMIINDIVF